MQGIYLIFNRVSKKVYIGSSVDIMRRFHDHRKLLRRNRHDNQYLQNSWNKHKEKAFKFSVLEIVLERDRLLSREQFWIDKLKNKYNLLPKAGNRMGFSHSPLTKHKISLAVKGKNLGIKNPMHNKSLFKIWQKKFGEQIATEMLNQYKIKMAKLLSGKQNPFYGKKHNYHTKRLLSKKLSGRKMPISFCSGQKNNERGAKSYEVTTPLKEKIIILNLTKFCRENHLDAGNAFLALKNKKSYRGFLFSGPFAN